jgi:3-deoxy-D-manno-octulosonic-acid transferase
VISFTYFLYNFTFTILSFCALPFFLLKDFFAKESFHKERWGFYSPEVFQKLGGKPRIWLHAASVGEVRVALTLLGEMKKVYSRHSFVISTTTPQGRVIASQAHGVDVAILAPLDLPWVVRRTVRLINPHLLLVAETELWPNLLKKVKKKGVPIILFNGRISRRSFCFYRLLRFFFSDVLQNFDALCLKSNADSERMIHLGAPPTTIHVTGDLKFHHISAAAEADNERLRRELRLSSQGEPIFIAGSTHEGEEEIILRVFKELQRDFPQLILILAPRHLQRIPRVESILKTHRVRWVRRTMISEEHRPEEVILLDTLGELSALYGLGTVIFVGGSFGRVGGHNVLEVLNLGTGVIFGPHMENVSDIAQLVVKKGAGVQVSTPDELREVLVRLIADPSLRKGMGLKGLALLQEHQGALERTMKIVKEFFTG